MGERSILVKLVPMSSQVSALQWHTAKSLHQIQLLSCDYVVLQTWKNPNLSAPFWRLYWHDNAGGTIVIRGKVIHFKPDQLVLIPPNTPFSSDNNSVFGQLFMHFLLEPGIMGRADKIYMIQPEEEQRKLAVLLKDLLCGNSSDVKASLLGQALVSLTLLHIPLDDWISRYSDSRITAAVAAIRAAYPNKVTNATLAKNAGLHPNAFIRVFRECTGHTPVEYLTNLRLEEACVMLHYTDSSIDEIAEKTGFCDRAYFSHVFTEHMTVAPAKYRNLVNTNNRLRK
jgi:AraC-like DNA-binding protein